jgi:tyrosinase
VTVTTQPPVAAGTAPTRLNIRKSVDQLDADELGKLRQAFSLALPLNDTRGFEYFAGWHGVSLGWCQHHNELFLPWHRAYLYCLELALQDRVPGVTLPWWDWSTDATIPAAYTSDDAGAVTNELAALPITVFGAKAQPNWPTVTSRDPGGFPQVPAPPYRQEWARAMAATNYADFSQRIWQVHDTVHVWVGGTMGQVDWAAYDPVFFAHHANVDRAWRIWQTANPGAGPSTSIIDQPLQVVPAMTVKDTLDVRQLGYEYAGTQATVPGSA